MEELLKRYLGKTGMGVSVISYGGLVLKGDRVSQEQTEKVLKHAIDMGVNYIDTARAYGESEEKIGNALESLGYHSKVFLASKTSKRHGDEVKEDVDKSLELLKTDYIDVYQIHYIQYRWQLKKVLADDGALRALEQLKEQGVIGHIGISGHCNKLLVDALRTDRFDTVMPIFNILQRDAITSGLVETAREKDVGIIAMKALLDGVIRPAHSLPFVLKHVDTISVGMGTRAEAEKDVAFGSGKMGVDDEEYVDPQEIIDSVKDSRCIRCNYCYDRKYEDVHTILPLYHYRNKYPLTDEAEEKWRKMIDRAKNVDYTEAEQVCPRHLPVGDLIGEAIS